MLHLCEEALPHDFACVVPIYNVAHFQLLTFRMVCELCLGILYVVATAEQIGDLVIVVATVVTPVVSGCQSQRTIKFLLE